MKKESVIFIICLALIGSAVGAALWLQNRKSAPYQTRPCQAEGDDEGDELTNEHHTNSVIYYQGEIPPADPLMVGRWQNLDDKGWHKVYYDDDDGEGHYWGKEWNETDDVLEDDLSYHGNGWFRWTKSNDTLVEYATMDFRDVPIAHIYLVTMFDSLNIAMAETNGRSTHQFVKE